MAALHSRVAALLCRAVLFHSRVAALLSRVAALLCRAVAGIDTEDLW